MSELSVAEFAAARDHLIDEGMRLGNDPFEAVNILTTAGFSILAVTIGLANARSAMPGIVAGFLDELPPVN